MPLASLTLATLRSAEFGFLGVVVYTLVQTPRFCGHSRNAGEVDFLTISCLPLRISWLIVGTHSHLPSGLSFSNLAAPASCEPLVSYSSTLPRVSRRLPCQI